jgi:hypothetical protein
VQALEQLVGAAQGLAASAAELAAAIAEDPAQPEKIGRALQSYTLRLKATRIAPDVVNQALKRWVLLNPGVSQRKL